MTAYWKGKKLSDEHKKKLSDAHKGKKLSDAHRESISESTKGKNTWSKGKVLSGDTRKKMSESRKGRKLSDDTRKKISESHKGKEKTEEHRKNIGISGKGRMPHNKGIKSGPMSLELRKKHSEAIKGEKHPNWQGGKTPDSLRVRRSQDTRIWRESVFERDGYTCQECGKKGVYLHAHHIKRFSEYPELRFDLSNGITLCRDCHRGVHRKRSN